MSTYLRHSTRHLQRTLGDHITTHLQALGWLSEPAPFGTTPVVVMTRRFRESEATAITGNLVAVTFGEEPDDEDLELGGGLEVSRTEMFIDVVAVNDPVGLALATDIKDLLSGRAPGTSRFLRVRDYTAVSTGVETAAYQVEIVAVQRQRPDISDIKQFWQTVVAGLEMTFPGNQ